MRKPKDWGQPCPNPDYCYYRLIHRGNMSAISPYLTQSGKRRIFRCSKCEGTFSETRDTVFFDLRTPEEKVMLALKIGCGAVSPPNFDSSWQRLSAHGRLTVPCSSSR